MNKDLDIGVTIVEDSQYMRTSLVNYVSVTEGFRVIGAYPSCEEMLANIKNNYPRIVLMDIELEGMSGIEGVSELKRISPKTDVIMVTVFENSESVFAALKAGATGYLTKTIDRNYLILAIKECIGGGAPMSMKIARMVTSSFNRNPKNPLSDREIEVLSSLAEGKSYRGVSEILFISVDTVKYHIKSIYSKLQANSKQDAIDTARKEKYI